MANKRAVGATNNLASPDDLAVSPPPRSTPLHMKLIAMENPRHPPPSASSELNTVDDIPMPDFNPPHQRHDSPQPLRTVAMPATTIDPAPATSSGVADADVDADVDDADADQVHMVIRMEDPPAHGLQDMETDTKPLVPATVLMPPRPPPPASASGSASLPPPPPPPPPPQVEPQGGRLLYLCSMFHEHCNRARSRREARRQGGASASGTQSQHTHLTTLLHFTGPPDSCANNGKGALNTPEAAHSDEVPLLSYEFQ
eukprot:6800600-Pyramimonas_sp.AAC.1